MLDEEPAIVKKILEKFENVSVGRSFSAEIIQDCQLQLFSEENYYKPYDSNIYYAQIGKSTRMKRDDCMENNFEGYDRFTKFLENHGIVLDQMDLAFIEYMKAYRSGNMLKSMFFYLKSIDFSLGIAGLQLKRIVYVLKNRILKTNINNLIYQLYFVLLLAYKVLL